MSNKFNANALTEYSKSYARRIVADYFQQHAIIGGRQILTLTPINQVNLFVISSLSDKWQADAEKFRSPYFDFTNAEVQEALQNFMNVVSQHISVRREHLEPLLADAVRRTLTLIFDPRAYFDDILRGQPDFTLTADTLKQITRYTKINQFIPAHITQRLNGRPFIYVNQALNYLDEALTQHSHEIEYFDKYVTQFSEKLPIDLSVLLRGHVLEGFSGAPTRSFFDTATESAVPPAPLVPTAPVMTPKAPESEPDYTEPSASEEPTVSTQPVAEVEEVKAEPEPIVELRESYRDEDTVSGGPMFLDGNTGPEPVAPISQPSQLQTGAISTPTVTEVKPVYTPAETAHTLNDTLRETVTVEPVTVAETFHRAPIESVARSISLNQKFRFINQLFNGNTSAYNQAVEEIDTLNNYGQALDLISYRYASQYLWDMSSDEVSELVEILKRRFA
jgi:hypothetical protein